MMATVYKLPPLHYVHVLDSNTCEVATLLGPLSYTLYSYHKVLHETPQPCIIVPPGHYVKIHNPVHRFNSLPNNLNQETEENSVHNTSYCGGTTTTTTTTTQIVHGGYELISNNPDPTIRNPLYVEVQSGCFEYRFAQEPFPLFPGEIAERVLPMLLLKPQEALLIRVVESYEAEAAPCTSIKDTSESSSSHGGKESKAEIIRRVAGEMYVYKGPGKYTPRIEEIVVKTLHALEVHPHELLHLQAQAACTDAHNTQRVAGEEWSVEACGLYFVLPHIQLVKVLKPIALCPSKALKIKALTAFYDDRYFHIQRSLGDEWLITHEDVHNTFTPSHCEEVVGEVELLTLTTREYAIIANPFHDGCYHWGEQEIRRGPCAFFIHPHEMLMDGKVHSGILLDENEALLVEAIRTFTEELEENIQEGEEKEKDEHTLNEVHRVEHLAASKWLIHGPCTYYPPLTVRVIERRCVLALNKAEGVYVRNVRTGEIRSKYGKPFMLSEDEELWAKPVSRYVQLLLQAPNLSLRVQEVNEATRQMLLSKSEAAEMGSLLFTNRRTTIPSSTAIHYTIRANKVEDNSFDEEFLDSSTEESISEHCKFSKETQTQKGRHCTSLLRNQPSDLTPYRMISANIGANSLVRLYDVSTGKSRVEVGPTVVFLGPHEEFTVLALSGGRPKRPRQIHTLKLYLGPDYMSDIIEVETLDHARPKLHVAYNWEFDTSNMSKVKSIAFTIPDFVSEACKSLASRIRAAIASVNFENFHRNSLSLIRQAVFDVNSSDSAIFYDKEALYFATNGLRITNVDLQSVEPVDFKTQVALTKSVQLAVEIITRAQENEASHHAALLEQEAHGKLELQVMHDAANAEAQRQTLYQVMAQNMAQELRGSINAQQLAEAQARELEAQTDVHITPLRCEVQELTLQAELDILNSRMEMDLNHVREMNALEVAQSQSLAEIEARKHEEMMSIIGMDTLVQLALAGPELQQKLLSALGLQGYLITNGATPINLLSAAQKMTDNEYHRDNSTAMVAVKQNSEHTYDSSTTTNNNSKGDGNDWHVMS